MFKNLTIRQLSLYITAVIILVNALIIYALYSRHGRITDLPILLTISSVGIVMAYLIVRYLLEEYIFRKIKLIYKIIHNSKINTNTKKVNINATSIDEVNDEVVKWAEDTEKEIKSLKLLEKYRKDFVGNISHELKTPIFSIQGYLHTLLDGGMNDPEVNVKYLQRAANNAERLQSIVEDLETISNLESGKLILDIRKFDIKELANEVIIDLQVFAEEKNIKIVFKDGANQSFNVLADREKIRQVLSNLIVNSIKYGEENGTTKISFYDIDKNILVEISDNGCGIKESHVKHLFDRFYRVDSSRSRAEGGSGLGLSIVKHIIEAHNQTINVRSTPDVGSTFGFTLRKSK